MYPLRVLIACPAKPGTRYGNRVTALRWQRIFRHLGCRTQIASQLGASSPDCLVALHARRSAQAISEFHSRFPDRPLVVALTGTDLYRDILRNSAAKNSLRLASRIVVLQQAGRKELTPAVRRKTRVIYQSVVARSVEKPVRPRQLRVTVAGHLREVKDPFRAAQAVRHLPSQSRIVVHHYGGAMTHQMAARAHAEMRRNPRYQWHGEVPRSRIRRALARSWLMVLSSRMEGGANILCEALSDQVPVLATRIPGSVGILGENYLGYFAVGATKELRTLLERSEADPSFYQKLRDQCMQRRFLVDPEREIAAWRSLLEELNAL